MYCDLRERSAILNELLDMLKHPKAPRDLTIYSLIEVKKGDRAVKALSKRLDEEVEALSKRMDEKVKAVSEETDSAAIELSQHVSTMIFFVQTLEEELRGWQKRVKQLEEERDRQFNTVPCYDTRLKVTLCSWVPFASSLISACFF